MNILIEFLTANGRYGAGEYHRRVVFEILRKVDFNTTNIYALYDSTVSISFEDMREDSLGKHYNVEFIDLHNNSITSIIDSYNIDCFFIACSQRIGVYPEVKDVRCKVVCVTHDLLYEEWYNNYLYDYWSLLYSNKVDKKDIGLKATKFWQIVRLFMNAFIKIYQVLVNKYNIRSGEKELEIMKPIVDMLKNNPKALNVVVSEYSKATMCYNFGFTEEKIRVLYSPERIETKLLDVQDSNLLNIINSKSKYFLLVSADRASKNVIKTISAFNRYSEYDKDALLVLIGYNGNTPNRVISLPFLSDSDLSQAMKNCYALLYPSFFEGFGYPPLEAMKYGKPVLCSNTTSIPEVLGSAPIYFSPLYISDIFYSMLKLYNSDYLLISKQATTQYEEVRKRQESDLEKLVDMILN